MYDETFALFDKDHDGCIDQGEYIAFLEHMHQKMGKKTNFNFPVALMNFDRADSDKNGATPGKLCGKWFKCFMLVI